MNTRPTTRLQRWASLSLLALIPLLVAGLVTSVLGGAAERTDRVPALIVNNDEMVTVTGADGTKTPLLAGRLIVTALTGPDNAGFDWSLANAESAEKALKNGTAYAVLTIPKNFSASISTLGGKNPEQANVTLTTDDAHSYLAGTLAGALGQAMTSAIGKSITEKALDGLYTQLDRSLSSAADGASKLADGANGLHTGLISFSAGLAKAADGAASASSGVNQFVDGVSRYSNGVDQLAAGLGQLNQGANQMNQGLKAYCPDPAATLASCAMAQQLTVGQLTALLDGINGLDDGAAALSAGSAQIRSGGTQVAGGIGSLSGGLATLNSGAASLSDGAGKLGSGASDLAAGLKQGVGQTGEPAQAAKTMSDPITLTSTTEHRIEAAKDFVGLIAIPAALWLGALGIMIVLPMFRPTELQSTRRSARIVAEHIGRGWLIAMVQAVLASAILLAFGLSLGAITTALALAVAATFSFVAIHSLLKLVLPRTAGIVSMVLLVLQLVLMPGLLPTEMLPTWVQALSGALPLSWAMTAMQSTAAGVGAASVAIAAAGLASVGLIAALLTTMVLSRRRLSAGFGFVLTQPA